MIDDREYYMTRCWSCGSEMDCYLIERYELSLRETQFWRWCYCRECGLKVEWREEEEDDDRS